MTDLHDEMAALDELRRRETELQQPPVRGNATRLNELLHPDFYEVGRSGRAHDRNSIVKYLLSRGVLPTVVSWNFKLKVLGADAALLTYVSAHRQPDGAMVDQAYRSSIWLKTSTGWKLVHHQGTPITSDS